MIYVLLIVYQLKHFIADYPLQNKYMLGKFLLGWTFLMPLLAHVSVHGLFTMLVSLFFNAKLALLLAFLDMIIHFFMDRIKASPQYLGRFKPLTKETYPTATPDQIKSNTYFWWALGLDQMVHHLTHYLLIYLMVQ